VERDALVHPPVGATAVALDQAGGPLDATEDVLDQLGLVDEVRAEVAHAGHPGTAAVVRLAPGDRVVVAHGVAAGLVGRLVHGGGHVRGAADVRGVVVPLVGSLPALREVLGRGVGAVLHPDRAGEARVRAGGGVTGHQRTDHVVPPVVAPAHVGGVV